MADMEKTNNDLIIINLYPLETLQPIIISTLNMNLASQVFTK